MNTLLLKKGNYISYLLMVFLLILSQVAYTQQLAQRPPMGWNSWNCMGFEINETQVKEIADYMSENLLEYGYEYLVIDGGWYYPVTMTTNMGHSLNPPQSIDNYGRLVPDTIKFPSSRNGLGFKPLADYVHSKGLKFGIHIMRGIPWNAYEKNTPVLGTNQSARNVTQLDNLCEWNHSMYGLNFKTVDGSGYYESIFSLYKEWGIDLIKVDDVAREFHDKDILAINKAIENTGRSIVLSLSPGPTPLKHANFFLKHANMFRISNDFWDGWKFVLRQFDYCEQWYPYITPGHWPDADMLPFGKLRINGGDDWIAGLLKANIDEIKNELSRFSNDEMKTVFTLFSIFRSPLMYGGYFPESDSFSINLLKNKEVIQVNQNSINNKQLFKTSTTAAWVADVPDSNAKYVALFNLSDKTAVISVDHIQLGIAESFKVRDLWSKTELGKYNTKFSVSIPAHGSEMYKIEY